MTDRRRYFFIVLFLVSTIVCSYDIFMALHGRTVAWAMAAIMGLVCLIILRKLVIQDYSSSWW